MRNGPMFYVSRLVKSLRAAWTAGIYAFRVNWNKYRPVSKDKPTNKKLNGRASKKVKGPADLYSIDDEWVGENTEQLEAEFVSMVRKRLREAPSHE